MQGLRVNQNPNIYSFICFETLLIVICKQFSRGWGEKKSRERVEVKIQKRISLAAFHF